MTDPHAPGTRSARRRVVVLGDGVIGTTYGMLLAEAGHGVTHLIRPERRDRYPIERRVELLDGRRKPAREGAHTYRVVPAAAGTRADLVLVSVPDAGLAGALEALARERIGGPVLLFNGIWESRRWLTEQVAGRPCPLGYPVAGGGLTAGALHSVVFDHVVLEGHGPHRDDVAALFASAGIGVESPADVLEWIWVHIAVNAGVVAVAAAEGDPGTDPAAAARNLMDSRVLLREAVLTVRECLTVVAARGVRLSRYRSDVLPFLLPSALAARAMHRLFRRDLLARRIMELHNDAEDLHALLTAFDATRRDLGLVTPRFSAHLARALPHLEALRAG